VTLVEGDGVRLRPAGRDDLGFLAELARDEDVEPFLSPLHPSEREALLAEVARAEAEPDGFGRFLLEARDGDAWLRAGMMGFEATTRVSRIARVGGVAVHRDFRRRGLAEQGLRLLQRHLLVDLDYHRLELECYGFNEQAIALAERTGFVREGVRRRAWRRHGAWNDGILFGLTQEDLQ
jgi:RimJ/RimL family protein N-acetyltransferase